MSLEILGTYRYMKTKEEIIMLNEMIKEYTELMTSLNESKEKANAMNKEMYKTDIKDRLADKDGWKKQLDKYAHMENFIKHKQEYLYILQYNMFNAFIVENMETIREIVNKYANKPIGEKRSENLYNELHALIPKEVMYIFSISINYRTFGGIEIYLNYKNNRHWVWIIDSGNSKEYRDSNTYSELTEEKTSDIINDAKGKIVNDIDKYIADTYEKIAVLNGKIEEVEKLYSEIRDAADEMNIWSYDTTVKKYRI